MSNESLYKPVLTIPKAVVVFGTSPGTNYQGELQSRIDKLSAVLESVRPQQLYLIGGQRWSENGTIYSEAERLALEIGQQLGRSLEGIEILAISEGLETISQTNALVDLLKKQGRIPGTHISLLSSWHQTIRAGMVFFERTGSLPTLVPTFYTRDLRTLGFDITINLFAGLSYTGITLLLNKLGYWEDGGRYLQNIVNRRKRIKARLLKTGRNLFKVSSTVTLPQLVYCFRSPATNRNPPKHGVLLPTRPPA